MPSEFYDLFYKANLRELELQAGKKVLHPVAKSPPPKKGVCAVFTADEKVVLLLLL